MKPRIYASLSSPGEWCLEYWNHVLGNRFIRMGDWKSCIVVLLGLYQSKMVTLRREY